MLLFDTKGLTHRVLDTIEHIKKIDPFVANKGYRWCNEAHTFEIIRITSKMHLGKSLTLSSEQRQYKRGIIFLKAAIMREEIKAVMVQVSVIPAAQLKQHFLREVRKARSFKKLTLPIIQLLEANNYHRITDDAKQTMMKLQSKDAISKLKQVACEIYSPFYKPNSRDRALNDCLYSIRHKLLPSANSYQTVLSHTGQLTRLNEGGNLYIVGHGNLGQGIGTHDNFLNEMQLTQALIASNLTKNSETPINIYLFACWTATSVKKTYKRGKTEPFAKRFSRALAAAGFKNLRVIGFAGSVNGLKLQQELNFVEGVKDGPLENLGLKNKYCIYEINQHNHKRIYGVDWTTDMSYNWKRERTQIQVRARGGNLH